MPSETTTPRSRRTPAINCTVHPFQRQRVVSSNIYERAFEVLLSCPEPAPELVCAFDSATGNTFLRAHTHAWTMQFIKSNNMSKYLPNHCSINGKLNRGQMRYSCFEGQCNYCLVSAVKMGSATLLHPYIPELGV